MVVSLDNSRPRPVDVARPRRVSILGSTGSVGRSTIDLVARDLQSFEVVALTANRNAAGLAEQARHLRCAFAAIADPAEYQTLRDALADTDTEVAAGREAVLEAAARSADWTMAAIVGARGLAPTLEAVRQGRIVAFANKECLVSAGPLMLEQVQRHNATLLPVDSEHNAIFQVFDSAQRDSIERLILTASGGPFRTAHPDAMAQVTPEQAVAHPTWNMGAKISVDSATMMNKGLEIIEASLLFDMPDSRIDVLVHPQSVIHSLVAHSDGSVLAQLGTPDMRTPIAYCLAWPKRIATPTERLDLAAVGRLDFEPPDMERFPALRLAREALRRGESAPTVLNAANEEAVHAFLERRIGFLDIVRVVEQTLERVSSRPLNSLTDVSDIDEAARHMAREILAGASGPAKTSAD